MRRRFVEAARSPLPALPRSAVHSLGFAPEMQTELDSRLEALGAKGHHELVAGAIRGEQHLFSAWSAADEPPADSSLFEIGSITKTLTGILLADMSLRGEVGLDDPLSGIWISRGRPDATVSRRCSSWPPTAAGCPTSPSSSAGASCSTPSASPGGSRGPG